MRKQNNEIDDAMMMGMANNMTGLIFTLLILYLGVHFLSHFT